MQINLNVNQPPTGLQLRNQKRWDCVCVSLIISSILQFEWYHFQHTTESNRSSQTNSKTTRDKGAKSSAAPRTTDTVKISSLSQGTKPKIEKTQNYVQTKESVKFTKQTSTNGTFVEASSGGTSNGNGIAWKDSKNFAQKLKEQLSSVPPSVTDKQVLLSCYVCKPIC